jgi:hypothetical protein
MEPDNFRSLFPAKLLVVSTDELAAPTVASLADGGPMTARQFRSEKELNGVFSLNNPATIWGGSRVN